MLKILSSEYFYMPVVKFFPCLGVVAYLNLNKNPHFWTDTK